MYRKGLRREKEREGGPATGLSSGLPSSLLHALFSASRVSLTSRRETEDVETDGRTEAEGRFVKASVSTSPYLTDSQAKLSRERETGPTPQIDGILSVPSGPPKRRRKPRHGKLFPSSPSSPYRTVRFYSHANSGSGREKITPLFTVSPSISLRSKVMKHAPQLPKFDFQFRILWVGVSVSFLPARPNVRQTKRKRRAAQEVDFRNSSSSSFLRLLRLHLALLPPDSTDITSG